MKLPSVTIATLEKGDKISHPTWGELEFDYRTGSRHYFYSREWGIVDIIDFGTKFKLIKRAK